MRITSEIPPASTMSGCRMSGIGELDQVAEVPAVLELLAGRDRDVERPADLAQAGHVLLGEWLLEMGDTRAPRARRPCADRRAHRVAAVGIEPDPDVGPQRLAAATRHLDVLGRVDVGLDRAPVHPDLERAEALVAATQDVGDHLLRASSRTRRRRSSRAGCRSARHRPAGHGSAGRRPCPTMSQRAMSMTPANALVVG